MSLITNITNNVFRSIIKICELRETFCSNFCNKCTLIPRDCKPYCRLKEGLAWLEDSLFKRQMSRLLMTHKSLSAYESAKVLLSLLYCFTMTVAFFQTGDKRFIIVSKILTFMEIKATKSSLQYKFKRTFHGSKIPLCVLFYRFLQHFCNSLNITIFWDCSKAEIPNVEQE